ncbi:hypothetical protein Hanom_Chr11g00989691 [Helianthus anomalus]
MKFWGEQAFVNYVWGKKVRVVLKWCWSTLVWLKFDIEVRLFREPH